MVAGRGRTKGDPGDRGFKPKPILGLISPESSHTWPCICPENYEPISRQSRGAGGLAAVKREPPPHPGPSPAAFAAPPVCVAEGPLAPETCLQGLLHVGDGGQGPWDARTLVEVHETTWHSGRLRTHRGAGRRGWGRLAGGG